MSVELRKAKKNKGKKIINLDELSIGDVIVFEDGYLGLIIRGDGIIEDRKESGTSILLLNYPDGDFWGMVSENYLNGFKKGNYDRIIKQPKIIIEE